MPEYELDQFDVVLRLHEALKSAMKIDSNVYFDPRDDDGLDWTKEYKVQMGLLTQRGSKSFYQITEEFFNAA